MAPGLRTGGGSFIPMASWSFLGSGAGPALGGGGGWEESVLGQAGWVPAQHGVGDQVGNRTRWALGVSLIRQPPAAPITAPSVLMLSWAPCHRKYLRSSDFSTVYVQG